MSDASKALIGFAAIALVFFFPLIQRITDHILADDIFTQDGLSDSYTFLWHYWWTIKAVMLGSSPLACNWVLPPTGADLTFHTTAILPSLIAAPLGQIFGVVVGYNLMVMGMIVGGAFACYLVLRRVFDLNFTPAFVAAALFGYSPYFILKAHAHVNLIGAVFWVGALGFLLAYYLQSKSGRAVSLGFALFLWATFWSSLLEFLMLALIVAVLILYFEVEAIISRRSRIVDSLKFFVPSLAGTISLAIFIGERALNALDKPLFEGFSPSQFFSFSRFCLVESPIDSPFVEFQGSYLSIPLVIMAAVGLVSLFRQSHRLRWLLVTVIAFCLLAIIDPWHAMSSAMRLLPFGTGFRVLSRYQAFLLFFAAIAAGIGIQHFVRMPRPGWTKAIALVLAVVAFVEMYPYRLNPSPVKSFAVPESVNMIIDRSKRVLILPTGYYSNVHDTYQIALDEPAVYLSYLAREDQSARDLRRREYPIVYGAAASFDVREYERELDALNIGYVLFEDERDLKVFPIPTVLLWRQDGQALYRVVKG